MKDYGGLCSVLTRRADAAAFINGSEKYNSIRGRILFYSVRRGILIRAELSGLPRFTQPCGNPVFGFHLHGGEACTGDENDPFAGSGSHFNPDGCPHPYHAGDFPPLFGADGSAFSVFLTDRFTLPEVIGKTVIIHSMPDDFTTQPSGNAGEKIACGVILASVR